MPRISELDGTIFPTLEHEFATEKAGESVKLTIQQVRDILEYAATEIGYNAGTVAEALDDLASGKVDIADYTSETAATATTIDGKMVKAQNLNDVANKTTARANLGVAIGSDVQAYSAALNALGGALPSANLIPYYTGAASVSYATLTPFARSLIEKVDAIDMRTVLEIGAGKMATQSAAAVNITGGTMAGVDFSTSYTTGNIRLAGNVYVYSNSGGALGDVRAGVKFDGSTQQLEFWTANIRRGYIRNDGYVLFPGAYALTTSAAANMVVDVAGFLQRSTSGRKYKKDIKPYLEGIEKLNRMKPVTFRSRQEQDGNQLFAGFIAEDMHDAELKEFVSYNEEGEPDAVHYGNITALLAKALQEAVAKIETLEGRLAALENA